MARVSRKDTIVSENSIANCNLYMTAIYTRLSIENGGKKDSDSIENQRYMLEKFVEEQEDLKLIKVYCDNGYTGTNFERPEWNRLMNDIKQGEINCIVVKDLSRFGRDYIETGNYLEKIFPFLGTRFIAVNDHYDSHNSNNSNEILMSSLKNLVNDMYAKDISKKVSGSFRMKQKKGEYLGGNPPYGYLYSEEGTHKLVIDRNVMDIVKQIYTWVIEGMSDRKIAMKLNKMEILPPARYLYEIGFLKNKKFADKKYWHDSAIAKITSNPVYAGHMAQGRKKVSLYDNVPQHRVSREEWIIVPNTHEAIIDKEIFEKVQEIRDNRKNKYNIECAKINKLGRTEDIFIGKIHCGDCKRNLQRRTVERTGDMARYAYVCPTYMNNSKSDCDYKYVNEKHLKTIVFGAIQQQVSLAGNMDKILQKMNKSVGFMARQNDIEIEIRDLNNLLKRNITLRSSLYEDYMDEILTEEEYLFAKKKYQKEEQALKNQLDSIQSKKKKTVLSLTSDNKWMKSMMRYSDEKELSRKMVVELISDIQIVNYNNISIKFAFQDEYKLLCDYIVEACG